VREELIESPALTDWALLLVWIPMLEPDNEEEAAAIGRKFVDPRVAQFYDAEQAAGIAYRRDVFPDAVRDALASLPPEHDLREGLAEIAEDPPEAHPAWDMVLFYPPGVRWEGRPPVPLGWSRQTGFFGSQHPDSFTGLFWRNTFRSAPVESDWAREIREHMAAHLW
jgi:hypothetical protein